MLPLPNMLTENAYTYAPEHCFGVGWALFDETTSPTIQRIDEAGAFDSDADAAFHVLCAAAFDPAREGQAARTALRKIIRFGEQGLNPIATMVTPRRKRAHVSIK